MSEFTHFNRHGEAVMVDVGEKKETKREAVAEGRITMSQECFEKVKDGTMGKGDVLAVARIAGIMGAKRTSDLIPLCHILNLTKVEIQFSLEEESCAVQAVCTVKTTGKTGVEMEALTAASVAALTIYDMCKAVQKDMTITDIRLLQKRGGVHGDYMREECK